MPKKLVQAFQFLSKSWLLVYTRSTLPWAVLICIMSLGKTRSINSSYRKIRRVTASYAKIGVRTNGPYKNGNIQRVY